jgi:4-amino-4-deoxychorismate lyase
MSRFLESIMLHDGVFFRLSYHQARVNSTLSENFGNNVEIDIEKVLNNLAYVPTKGLFKCRIVYDSVIQQIEITPYVKRVVKTFKLVKSDVPITGFKTEDRELLNNLFGKRDNCDDVIIVRNGLLTDTSYANIALFDGLNWHTPSSPIIFGTHRAALIDKKIIKEKEIRLADLKNYSNIRIFNAMLEFGEVELDVSAIQF